jgi:hypothetical protein
MSARPPRVAPRPTYGLLERAVERHLAWAYDFTVAGDLASAVDALLDARAAAAELAPAGAGGPARAH